MGSNCYQLWVCLCFPRHIHCSRSTVMAPLCTPVSELVSCTFSTIPICPFWRAGASLASFPGLPRHTVCACAEFSQEFRITLGYSRVGLRHSRIFSYNFPLDAMDGFEKAVAYALQRLNSPDLQLKPEQENSLRALYSGKDTFVWLPTGFGKSLCYTALPFLYDSKLGRTASTSVSLYIPSSVTDNGPGS